jgi:hypothetical protein
MTSGWTLEKILASRAFSKVAPAIAKFLRFVVDSTTLDGHGNQIKEYTVGL